MDLDHQVSSSSRRNTSSLSRGKSRLVSVVVSYQTTRGGLLSPRTIKAQ